MNRGIVMIGRLVVVPFTAIVILFISYLLCISTGFLQHRLVQVVTPETYESSRWSIHFLGTMINDSQPVFQMICFFFILLSLAGAGLIWRHLGRRWSPRS